MNINMCIFLQSRTSPSFKKDCNEVRGKTILLGKVARLAVLRPALDNKRSTLSFSLSCFTIYIVFL